MDHAGLGAPHLVVTDLGRAIHDIGAHLVDLQRFVLAQFRFLWPDDQGPSSLLNPTPFIFAVTSS